jgi:ATP-dependent exoDNAse (exonuclease V) alpha subunit
MCPIIRKTFLGKNNDSVYDVGDPIMLKQNTSLFKNGDLAKIVDVNNKYYTIRLDDPNINVKSNKYDVMLLFNGDIRLPTKYFKPSLVRTVHSSQGLDFDIVIYVMNRHGYYNITRNMNYTAYSRSKKELYLLGYYNGFDYNKARLVNMKRNSILSQLIK